MKKSILGLLLLSLATVSLTQGVKKHGSLKVLGTALTNQQGEAVVLRGMILGWHNWWPRFYNAGAISWLKNDWGCNVVRAAMGVEPDGGYIKQPQQSL